MTKAKIDRDLTYLVIGGKKVPPGTYEVARGAKVEYHAHCHNEDNDGGIIYLIVRDLVSGRDIYSKWDNAYSLDASGSFTVESDMRILVAAGHWDGSRWIQDDYYG